MYSDGRLLLSPMQRTSLPHESSTVWLRGLGGMSYSWMAHMGRLH